MVRPWIPKCLLLTFRNLGETAEGDAGVGIVTNLCLEQRMDCQTPRPRCQVGEVTGSARHKGSLANTLCWQDWIHSFLRSVLGSRNYARGRSPLKLSDTKRITIYISCAWLRWHLPKDMGALLPPMSMAMCSSDKAKDFWLNREGKQKSDKKRAQVQEII